MVDENSCKERRDSLKEIVVNKIEGMKNAHDIFRWILSTFLILYFIILGFSLQKIIVLENNIAKMNTRLEYYEKFIRYNFRDSIKKD